MKPSLLLQKFSDRFSSSNDPKGLLWNAEALFNKGVTLGALGRSDGRDSGL